MKSSIVLLTSALLVCDDSSARLSKDASGGDTGSAPPEADSLFLSLSRADSAGLPPTRTRDTVWVKEGPGDRVEMMEFLAPVVEPNDVSFVRLNLQAIRAEMFSPAITRSVTLNLPNRVLQTSLRSRPADLEDASVLTGAVEGGAGPPGDVTLVQVGSVLSGTIHLADTTFSIRHLRNGIHVVERIQQQRFPPEKPPRRPPAPAENAPRADRAPLVACEPQVVDVLVVVTPSVVNALTGIEGARTMAQLATVETNKALSNSGVRHQIRLVQVVQTTYRNEGNIDRDLDRLKNPRDRYLDEVPGLRQNLHADMVSLWVESTRNGQDACGLGYLITDPSVGADYAYTVVRRNCATGYFSFGHELGHNFGAEHDRKNATGATALPYAYGYRDSGNRFRDIMAYDCDATCPRVQFYSTTAQTPAAASDRTVAGRALGIVVGDQNAADVARAIDLTMCSASNYY